MGTTNYHEAAHAILAIHHGARVSRLAAGRLIVDGKPVAGVCTFDRRGLSRTAQAEIYLAGPVAEQIIDPFWNVDEVKDDYARAAALLDGADPRPAIARVRAMLEGLLQELFSLAAALLKHGELDEAAVLSAIKRS